MGNKAKYKPKSFEDFSAENMRDPEFAFHYVATLTADGLSEIEALQRAIRAYGVQAFAAEMGITQGNLSRILSQADAKFSTIENIKKVLGIKNCHYKDDEIKRPAA